MDVVIEVTLQKGGIKARQQRHYKAARAIKREKTEPRINYELYNKKYDGRACDKRTKYHHYLSIYPKKSHFKMQHMSNSYS